jgi:hypothetical protein
MPIYALDSAKNSTNLASNVNGSTNNANHYLHDQAVALKNTKSGKYKDIQDFRFKIFQILEGIRLARDENVTERRDELTQLNNELNIIKSQTQSLVRY